MPIFSILSFTDAAALVWFLCVWLGYAWYSRRASERGKGLTLLAVTNGHRRAWMLQATSRDPRMLDGIIMQGLSASPSFFASAAILIIGGVLALLGTTDKAAEVVREIPFATQTSIAMFELKLMLLAGIFVYAFFRFSWSMRQYTFAALMLGAMPTTEAFTSGAADRERYAERAGTLVGMAAETFNDGIRAYYFSFAGIAWFFSPLALAIGAALVAAVLYGREFHSHVLEVLRD
ncbi:MAG TPA: DUF599 domain-containing protein [Ramlibacter sp.]|nr:DUF599 domain-containing protein [Ramlibacter sp.]